MAENSFNQTLLNAYSLLENSLTEIVNKDQPQGTIVISSAGNIASADVELLKSTFREFKKNCVEISKTNLYLQDLLRKNNIEF